jgi:hypothetical protein
VRFEAIGAVLLKIGVFRQHPEPHFSFNLDTSFFDYVPIKVFLISEAEKLTT